MKNNIFKSLSVVLIAFLVMPHITFAKWWSPTSWFARERVFQPNIIATSTENKDQKSTHFSSFPNFGNSNITNGASVLMIKEKTNESSRAINDTALDDLHIDDAVNLKATILKLQKEIDLLKNKERATNTAKEVPVEKIIYQDRIIEKPVEKFVYQDRFVEKPVEKIIYKDRVVEKPIEKIIYQDRVVEKQVEKIVYQDRIVQASCSTNNTSSSATSASTEYSDYNFDYKWVYETPNPEIYAPSNAPANATLSCPPTPRSIIIRKAVFKLSSSDVEKLGQMESKKDSNHQYSFLAKLKYFTPTAKNFDLERKDANTLIFFGSGVPICSNNGIAMAEISAAIYPLGLSNEQSVYFYPNIVPQMTEWDVWDNTTNKPVKIK